jgi:hypothetical protein
VELLAVISQKTEHLITSAVRTSKITSVIIGYHGQILSIYVNALEINREEFLKKRLLRYEILKIVHIYVNATSDLMACTFMAWYQNFRQVLLPPFSGKK